MTIIHANILHSFKTMEMITTESKVILGVSWLF